jgi:hypothetical protein
VTSNLTYKSTTGAGTTTVVAHSFVGGNNGATNLLTLLNNGKMGLNSATPPYPLTNSQGVTGFTTTYANYTNSQIASDVTDAAWIHITTPTTQATAFTLNTLVHYGASAVTVGAGSTVTNNVGFFASSGLSGGTNNYGFQSSLIAALTSYNIYADGTAKNYFAGNVGMGTTTPTAYLHIKAGTDAASTAPIKLTTGTVNTAAEAGTIEYNNTFHVTNSDATRRHIATAPNATKVTAAAPYTNDGYILINIGGTDFKVMTTV